MNSKTKQEEEWAHKHGDDYNKRNPSTIGEMDRLYEAQYGLSRTELNEEFLKGIPREAKILEVGANQGVQLALLKKMGFKYLYGIDVNRKAIELSKKINNNIDIIYASANDIPFKDGFFDVVFTSGVLIHIAPSDIKKIIKEVYRCSSKYIWGFEYYSDEYQEIEYQDKKNMLWKTDFPKLYIDTFPDLKLTKKKKIEYLNDKNIDVMFLLEKNI